MRNHPLALLACSSLIAAATAQQPAAADAASPREPTPAPTIQLLPPERLAADGKPIDLGCDIGHIGPLFTDIDGDGKQDLLLGTFAGRIWVFANVGTAQAPKFTSKSTLEADGVEIRIHNW